MTTEQQSMDDIREELDALQRELNKEGIYEPDVQEQIRSLKKQVQEARQHLEADDDTDTDADMPLLSDELESALENLEEDYPELTLRLQHAIRVLVNAGL